MEAFKSTLEEAAYADVIVKVCDLSDPEASQQLTVTDQVLDSLDCGDIPQLTVYNKCDRAPEPRPLTPAPSAPARPPATDGCPAGPKLDQVLADRVRAVAVLLPLRQAGLAGHIRAQGTMLTEEYRPEGVYCEGVVKADLHLFVYICGLVPGTESFALQICRGCGILLKGE